MHELAEAEAAAAPLEFGERLGRRSDVLAAGR